MARLYLGVDGGQSGTTSLIASESGQVIGTGRAGPCNHTRAPDRRERFTKAITASVNQAAAMAGIDPRELQFEAVCLGLSGGTEDKEQFARELIRSRHYKFTHDAEIALSGATAGRPGVVVIAGTGSIAFGRNERSETARAGGWGYVFGDEGGAFDIAREALRAALRFEEGWGEPTRLRAALLEISGAPSADALVHSFYAGEFPREAMAKCAPAVDRAATEGDSIAQTILARAGAALAGYARAVYSRLFPGEPRGVMSYAGGVFRSAQVLRAFSSSIGESPGCDVVPPRFIPAAGALIEAFRIDGRDAELSGVPQTEK
jgi:glucosamine kinase